MQAFEAIKNGLSAWLDRVAEIMIAAIVRVKSIPTVSLVEGDDGRLSIPFGDNVAPLGGTDTGLQLKAGRVTGRPAPQFGLALKGAQVQLLLRPERFIFKTLELPTRAAEFLNGVVRSQIDRLTPWSADRAAFGVTPPADAGGGRIAVTVAATARELLDPLLHTFTSFDACAVKILTRLDDAAPDTPAITIVEEKVGGILDVRYTRRIALAALLTMLLIAAAASIASSLVGSSLEARQDELERQIAHTRAVALASRNAPSDPKLLAEQALARRKNASPSSVITLEILSQVLPDDTYLTELRIDGDKLRLSGITRDAPGVIRLIEQTHHFSQATFSAPITHAASEPGDHFDIEARMEPDFALKP